ncbi:hypothetical protein ACFVY0_48955, partial [Streptomyces sp. NPDC058286]|uniref:hypothetical protein n=1 Tax=Streptomyces sp. NPDC058286 TaxID=3346422 RepID=UPI0036EFD4D9
MTAPEGSGKDDCVVADHTVTQKATRSNSGAHESRSTGRPSRVLAHLSRRVGGTEDRMDRPRFAVRPSCLAAFLQGKRFPQMTMVYSELAR